jgi:RNase P subunit RPR2
MYIYMSSVQKVRTKKKNAVHVTAVCHFCGQGTRFRKKKIFVHVIEKCEHLLR